ERPADASPRSSATVPCRPSGAHDPGTTRTAGPALAPVVFSSVLTRLASEPAVAMSGSTLESKLPTVTAKASCAGKLCVLLSLKVPSPTPGSTQTRPGTPLLSVARSSVVARSRTASALKSPTATDVVDEPTGYW